MNEITQTLEQFVTLAKSAKESYNNRDYHKIPSILHEMSTIHTYGFEKWKALYYILSEDEGDVFRFEWAEDYIIKSLESSETYEAFLQLLLQINVACSPEAITKAQEVIIKKTEDIFNSVDFYRFRQMFHDFIFIESKLFPLYYRVQPKIRIPDENMSEMIPDALISFDDNNELTVDYEGAQFAMDEFNYEDNLLRTNIDYRRNAFEESDDEERLNQVIIGLFSHEESIYQSCFINGELDMNKLHNAAPTCAKAHYMLLKTLKKEPTEWF